MRSFLHVLLRVAWIGIAFHADAQPVHPFPQALPDFFYYASAAPHSVRLTGGKALVAGHWSRGYAVARTLPDGTVDRTFGRDGVAELVLWGAGEYDSSPLLAPLADGRVLVAGNAKDGMNVSGCDYYYTDCNIRIAVFRLQEDGTVDDAFNRYGRLVLRVGGPTPVGLEDGSESFLTALDVAPDGSFAVLTDYPRVVAHVRSDGTLDDSRPHAAREHDFVAALPLFDAVLDQYFVTADPGELAVLERPGSVNGGWYGSDGWFHVYPAGWNATPTVPVCRFYGLPEAGLDSHVLSANPEECAALERHADWVLESREVFRVELPDPASGACAGGHAPVFRLWNGRRDSGHVLSTNRGLRDSLVKRGYVPEGWGPLGVAMCSAP